MLNLVLLGDPVAHSLSPRLHQAALAAAGVAGTYAARRVDTEGMAAAVEELRAGTLHGANVTMPHKELAARLADRLSKEAARAGSVNTLVMERGSVAGYSTDVTAIGRIWEDRHLPEGAPVLILGAGGAAAAAVVALEGKRIYLTARRLEAARRLLERLEVKAKAVNWGTPVEGAVIVNATPIGMRGESLPAGVLSAAAGVLDMAYGSRPTPAVVECRRRFLPVSDGLDMLVGQAEASFTLWTGRPAPSETMRAALETSQADRSRFRN